MARKQELKIAEINKENWPKLKSRTLLGDPIGYLAA